MAKIENDITAKDNIIEFEGEEFNLQMSMYVISQFEDFDEILNSLGKVETVIRMLTAMINADIKKRKLDKELYDPDYVAACIGMQEMPEFSKAVAAALGIREKTEAEKELDAIAEAEGAPDLKN